MAGYSGTPLPRKLGIKPGCRVAAVGAPASFVATLGELPGGASLSRDPSIRGAGRDPFDVVVLFVREQEALERGLKAWARRLAVDGGLWVAWPKAASPLAGELREGAVREAGLAAGLVDNKVCAFDADWSGLRFVYRLEDRPAVVRRRAGERTS